MPLGLEPPLHRRRVDFWTKSRAFTIEKARRLLGLRRRRWTSTRGSRARPRGTGRPGGCERAAGAWETARPASCWRAREPARGRDARRSTCRARRRASSGATGRPTTRWPGAWRATSTCASTRADLARVRAEYPSGPQGIFLKRASGGLTVDAAAGFPWVRRVRPDEGRLYYAKAFAHPLAAAPLVAVFGTRGLTLANGLLLSAALWLAFVVLRRRGLAPGRRLAVAVGSPPAHRVAALPRVAHAGDLRPRPRHGGARRLGGGPAAPRGGLFGVAGYLKPPNVLMAAPLGLDPLLPREGERLARAGPRPAASARRCAAAPSSRSRPGASTRSTPRSPASSTTRAASARPSTGASRSTRAGRRFDDSGDLDDDQPGGTPRRRPRRREGHGGERPRARPRRDPRVVPAGTSATSGSAASGACSRTSSRRCWRSRSSCSAGRATAPAGWRSSRSSLSWLAYIWVIPDNWYGGGGTVGNRYFLAVLPAFLFLVPARRALVGRRAAVAAAAVFLAPVLASPVRHSLRPGDARDSAAFRVLPGRAHDAQRPLGLHGALAQEAPLRLRRRTRSVTPTRTPTSSTSWTTARSGTEEWAGRAGLLAARRARRPRWCVRAFDLAPVERVVLRVARRAARRQVTARLGWRLGPRERGPGQARRDRASGRARPALLRHVPPRPAARVAAGRAAPRRPRGRRVRGRAPRHGPAVRGGADERASRPARARGRLGPRPARRAWLVDLPRASDGRFWSDGATYHAMAGSLAFDGDLEFTAADLARVRASYPGGPQGVFLKRVRGAVRSEPRLVYAKALVYPRSPRPLVRLARRRPRPAAAERARVPRRRCGSGTGSCAARRALGRRPRPARSRSLAGGVVPVYLLWQTPEIFNLALATAGLVAWRRERPVPGGGRCSGSRPTRSPRTWPSRCRCSWSRSSPRARAGRAGLRRGGAARGRGGAPWWPRASASTWLATGELNYQGGERKTFYDRYPFDPGVTFDSAGVWMTTDHLGPLVAGRDEDEQTARVAPPRAPRGAAAVVPAEPRLLLGRPLRRGARLLPGRRRRRRSSSCSRARASGTAGSRSLALGASWLGYILLIPDNWYGGGGTIGNRYFAEPRAARPAAAAARAGGLGGRGCRGRGGRALPGAGARCRPIHHSLRPGEHATRAAFRVLPAEITMLGDLSVFTDVWRKRRPYNAPGGDPAPTAGARRLLPVVPRRRHVRPGDLVRRGGLLAPRRRERGGRAAGARAPRRGSASSSPPGPRGTS